MPPLPHLNGRVDGRGGQKGGGGLVIKSNVVHDNKKENATYSIRIYREICILNRCLGCCWLCLVFANENIR